MPIELAPGELGRRLDEVEVAGARVNRAVYAAGSEMPLHTHPGGNLCVTLAGSYEERWGARSARVDGGQVLVKPPGVEHTDRFGPSDVSCINIDFTAAAWDELGGSAFRAPTVVRDPRVLQLGRELAIELGARDAAARLASQGLVLQIVAQVQRANERSSQPVGGRGSERWLEDVCDRLHVDYARQVGLDELARGAGVHPTLLTRRFRARFGCSVGAYLRRLRVAAVLRGLDDPELSLSQLALHAGFSDQSHMGRIVRRETGRTPGEWRRRLRADRSRRAGPF